MFQSQVMLGRFGRGWYSSSIKDLIVIWKNISFFLLVVVGITDATSLEISCILDDVAQLK